MSFLYCVDFFAVSRTLARASCITSRIAASRAASTFKRASLRVFEYSLHAPTGLLVETF